jgi:molecular chaperone GrpE
MSKATKKEKKVSEKDRAEVTAAEPEIQEPLPEEKPAEGAGDEVVAEQGTPEAALEELLEAIPEVPGEETADPAARVVELEAEVADLKDKLLRALAETENVRRRAERDRGEASRYAIANFARDILVVADNLRRALESVEADARQQDPALDGLYVGVELTEREMLNAFERCDIKAVDAAGKKFDHNLHEAMYEVEDPGQPAGTVVHVLQTGYVLGDRLLRPAKVGVAKGGTPEPAETEPEAAVDAPVKESTAAYEKRVDGPDEATGSQLDEEL